MLRRIFPEVAFNPEFQKLWWAQILSQVAFNTLLYSLIIRIAERTTSNTAVSFFILSFSVPAVIFGLFAGVYVDRWDRRSILIATNVLRTALIPLFYLAERNGFYAIYPLAIITSVVTQFFIPAEASKMATTVPHRILHQANSLFTFTLYTAIIIGPIAAGPALKYIGLDRLFVVLFVLFGLATIMTMLLSKDSKDREEKPNGEERKIHSELLDALKHIWGNSRVKAGILLLTFSQTMIQMIAAVAPGFARNVLGVDVADTSLLLLGPAALGMIVGALVLSRFGHRWNKKRLIVIGVFLAGIQLMILGAVRGFENYVDVIQLAVATLFTLGAANAMLDVPSQTAIQVHTPEELRGRVYGILNTMINGASFLPVLFAGVIADIFGVSTMIILLGIVVFLTGFYIQDKAKQLSTGKPVTLS